jgi:hypothetical protein
MGNGWHMERDRPKDILSLQPDVLDHAREFVAVVYEQAPGRYRELLADSRFQRLLGQANALNHGKLFAYAEFDVFRAEFMLRFPGATAHACINAFSKLFLKNDISMTNLVRALEEYAARDLLYLQGRRNPAEDADD